MLATSFNEIRNDIRPKCTTFPKHDMFYLKYKAINNEYARRRAFMTGDFSPDRLETAIL